MARLQPSVQAHVLRRDDVGGPAGARPDLTTMHSARSLPEPCRPDGAHCGCWTRAQVCNDVVRVVLKADIQATLALRDRLSKLGVYFLEQGGWSRGVREVVTARE